MVVFSVVFMKVKYLNATILPLGEYRRAQNSSVPKQDSEGDLGWTALLL